MSKLKIYACSGVGEVSQAKRIARQIEDAGWERNEVLRKYLGSSKDGGGAEYFLYIFIPENELSKYNAVVYKKRKQQMKTFAYVRELFVGHNYGTEDEMISIIRNGIETTFGDTVENVLAQIRSGERGVGIATEIVVAIISAVVTIVVAVISGIITYCQNVKIAQYTAPTYQEIEDSVPATTDFLDSGKKKGLLFMLAAGLGLMLFGSFRKRS